MKYMIMMFGGLGATMQNRSPEWITGMQELMMKLDTELKESGEVLAGHGLVDPSQQPITPPSITAPQCTWSPPEAHEHSEPIVRSMLYRSASATRKPD